MLQRWSGFIMKISFMQKKKKILRFHSFTAIGVKNNTWKLLGAKEKTFNIFVVITVVIILMFSKK